MDNSHNQRLEVPLSPLNPVSTVVLSVMALVVSVFGLLISIVEKPMSLGSLTMGPMAVLGLILSLIAVRNDAKRRKFKSAVSEYSEISEDKDYLPDILPSRSMVWVLAVISWALIILAVILRISLAS